MQRRTKAMDGWVNFPVDNPRFHSTQEGGMLVKLVVCDNREFDDQFGMCTGAGVFDVLTESFVGDDKRPKPDVAMEFETVADYDRYTAARHEWEAYHFPNLHADQKEDLGESRYRSRPYLASMVLGTTGWSGVDNDAGGYWICRFEDLSEKGQALYEQLQDLYPGCDLHLLTFLDT